MFADQLKYLRKNANYTQSQLSKILCVSKGTVAMWETNKRQPDYIMIKKIASLFNVTFDYLLDNEKKFELPKENTIRIIGRGGVVKEIVVSDEKRKAIETLLEETPSDKI